MCSELFLVEGNRTTRGGCVISNLEYEEIEDPLRGLGATALNDEAMISVQEVIDGFVLHQNARADRVSFYGKGNLWNSENDIDLEQQMLQFVYENPGRSYSAIFKEFKREGYVHSVILETYNILVYDRKILQRLNVGTDAHPRYAHFVTEFLASEPKKDVLYDVLGPI